jgi:hypothetical protein
MPHCKAAKPRPLHSKPKLELPVRQKTRFYLYDRDDSNPFPLSFTPLF